MYHFRENFFFHTKYCYFCKQCFVLKFLVSTFIFSLLNGAVSSAYRRLRFPIDRLSGSKKSTTWANSGLVVSFEDSTDQQIGQPIGSEIIPVFDEDSYTVTKYPSVHLAKASLFLALFLPNFFVLLESGQEKLLTILDLPQAIIILFFLL